MNPDPSTAKSVFLNAVEIPDADKRHAFVAEQCRGDDVLRRDVERLLKHFDSQGSFLESAAAATAAADSPTSTERPGAVVGAYKLLEQIGEGGFGVVFMAEQSHPVRRRVALKIIKPGMDSRQVVARFEAERQALAMMDHVNIARVFDGGATEGGRPYFVMELVHGVPITRYCDDNHLTPRERLELFVPVCHAIQHAHQKGIIHRDVKPSNVMITLYDGKPVPKVIDFGVAKATEQKLTEQTLFTNYGTMVGTLEYMSPEQAEMSALGVDTRSDIYSLGVLLYELLTGSTPLPRKRIKEAALGEILRIIKEEEPPRPSTRLSDSGEALASISAKRHMEPAKLTKLVRGELDWIVMKCLEKDRNRRYETANGFAMDVQRYLADEQVQACPPSTVYRLGKFVRRHRRAVLAATTIFLLLIGGIIGTTVGLVHAKQERAIAQAVNDFLQQDLLMQADPLAQVDRGFGADPNLTVKEALNRASSRIPGRFRDQPLTEAAIRYAIGDAYIGVGEENQAVVHLEQALALRKKLLGPDHLLTVSTMFSLSSAYALSNRMNDALALGEEAVKLRKARLPLHHPDTLESMEALATTYRYGGRLDDAVALHEETLKLMKVELGVDHRLTLRCMVNLGMDYVSANRFADAVELHEETLKLSRARRGFQHPGTLVAMCILAISCEASGQVERAVALHEESHKLMKAKCGADHPHTIFTAWSLMKAYRSAGRLTDAIALLEDSLKVLRAKRGPAHPDTLRNMTKLAELHADRNRYDLAEPLLRTALSIVEKERPDEWDAFEVRSRLGGLLLSQKKYAEAEPFLVQGYEGLKKHQAQISPNLKACPTEALERVIRLYDALGKPNDAAKWRRELEKTRKGKQP